MGIEGESGLAWLPSRRASAGALGKTGSYDLALLDHLMSFPLHTDYIDPKVVNGIGL